MRSEAKNFYSTVLRARTPAELSERSLEHYLLRMRSFGEPLLSIALILVPDLKDSTRKIGERFSRNGSLLGCEHIVIHVKKNDRTYTRLYAAGYAGRSIDFTFARKAAELVDSPGFFLLPAPQYEGKFIRVFSDSKTNEWVGHSRGSFEADILRIETIALLRNANVIEEGVEEVTWEFHPVHRGVETIAILPERTKIPGIERGLLTRDDVYPNT